MSEPHAEPPAADVRSFLPRPGEPVEDYAARLRALHHDLTLVLDAVERGLAAAERTPELVAEARTEAEEPRRSPRPPGTRTPVRGGARVEVIAAPATAQVDAPGGERAWSGPSEPEGSTSLSGQPAPWGEGAPAGGEPAAPSPTRSHEPWVESAAPAARREPWHEPPTAPWETRTEPWPERGAWPPPPPAPRAMEYEPAPHAPFAAPPKSRPPIPPVLVAATILGWLVVFALAIVLLFD